MKINLTLLTLIATITTSYAQNMGVKATNLIKNGTIKNAKAVPFSLTDNLHNILTPNHLLSNTTYPVNSSKIASINEDLLDSTLYDTQTYRSIANRIVRNIDGTISAVWTTSPGGNSAVVCGAGYSYWDGSIWNTSVGRIDSIQSYWPNIVVTASGHEMTISQTLDINSLDQCYRQTKGTGAWSTFFPVGFGNDDAWPRAVAGGANGESIHVICHGNFTSTTPENGLFGPLYYSRSTDGGATFSIQDQLLPGLDSAHMYGVKVDTYSIDARGDVIAIATGNIRTNLYLLKSIDNGITWTNTVVFHSPLSQPYDGTAPFPDLNTDGFSDTLELPSGDVHVMIDNNNMCHLWWSTLLCVNPGGAISYFPNALDGLYYWNENMVNSNGYVIAHAPDLDSNQTITIPSLGASLYTGAITEMPSSGIDSAGNLYVCYASVCELCDTTIFNTSFKHTYVIKSTDGGLTWTNSDKAIDILQNSIYEEGVFACMAKYVDNDIYLIYQKDYAPGHSLSSDIFQAYQNQMNPSYIMASHLPAADISTVNCGAYFTVAPDTVAHSWIVTNFAAGTPPLTYVWSWGDGTTSAGATPSHSYSVGGFYSICLTITDNAGCTSTMCDSSYLYKGNSSLSMINLTVVLPTTTSNNEVVNPDQSYNVHPNPFNNKLKIHSDYLNLKSTSIKIFNSMGAVIYTGKFFKNNFSVEANSFAKGIYLVELKNESTIQRFKVVKD